MKYIDFYSEIIDNYGDIGFALNIAINYLETHPKTRIFFYSNSKNIFDKQIGNNYKNIIYRDLSEIKNYETSNIIFNFFDRKLDLEYLYNMDFSIKILNFGYFATHSRAPSLHNTHYTQRNLDITHIAPSYLPNTGGLIVNHLHTLDRTYFSKKYNINISKPWISVFVYDETLKQIIGEIKKDIKNEYLIFDAKFDIYGDNITIMPFVDMFTYYNLLNICSKNIVRGENSFIQGVLAKRAFLWDIYKEDNGAHKYKIDEFSEYLNHTSYTQIFRDFNLDNTKKGFIDFIGYSDDSFFEKLGTTFSSLDILKTINETL